MTLHWLFPHLFMESFRALLQWDYGVRGIVILYKLDVLFFLYFESVVHVYSKLYVVF